VLCKQCYSVMYSIGTCSTCGDPILGEREEGHGGTHVKGRLDDVWHARCFSCTGKWAACEAIRSSADLKMIENVRGHCSDETICCYPPAVPPVGLATRSVSPGIAPLSSQNAPSHPCPQVESMAFQERSCWAGLQRRLLRQHPSIAVPFPNTLDQRQLDSKTMRDSQQ